MARTALIQQFTALGWRDTAAAELADIHLRLRAEGRLKAPMAAAMPVKVPAGARGVQASARRAGTGQGGRAPVWGLYRLLALAIVTALLSASLTACGGGGSEDPALDQPSGVDVRTPHVDCSADPRLCR